MNRLSLWLLPMMLIALLAFAADAPAGEDAASVLVATITPVQGKLDQPVTAYGIVQAAPGGSLAVASLHAAQVLRLRVVAGQVVAKGEPLLDLGVDPAASLAFAQAQSDLKLAQGEFKRTQQLLAERLATNSQLAQAEKAVSDAEATVAARRGEGGTKPVETLNAPMAGVVTAIAITNGDHVQPGATLLDISASDSGNGLLGVGPEDRGRIKPGQAVKIVDLDAPAEASAGAVVSVGGMADAKTGLFAVVVKPTADDAAKLVSGAHLRATIATDGVAGWIVPRDAVLTDDDGPYLFQIAGGKAARVAVEIAGASGGQYAVTGEIDPKKKLVVSGNYQLTDGMAAHEQAEPAPATDKTSK
jgi:membrane fusion protein (multidrug efflux system)